MKFIFWLCLSLIAYTYLIYPGLIFILARLFPKQPVLAQNDYPSLTMVISAYNEEQVLERKIKNCLAIDYPRDKISFVFGSDGSTDSTNQILETIDNPQIRSRIFSEREGKSSVLNKLIPEIEDQLILFSDANTTYHPDAVKLLVRHFSVPSVGGICGRLKLVNPGGTPGGEGEGLYWRFENMIKKSEGTIKSVISANGAIVAVRKELIDPLPTEVIVNDDFSITLMVLRKMKKIVYEPLAIAEEQTSPNMEGEFVRKIRIASLNFNALPELITLLHPRYGFTALAIFSHKILRWLVPFLGFGMLTANLLLVNQGRIYPLLLIGQGLVYVGALLGYLGDRFMNNSGPFVPFYYLAMINIAIVLGLWRSLTKTQGQTWKRVPH